MSGNLELYISAFDSNVTTYAANLPEIYFDTFGSSDVVFNATMNYEPFSSCFTFVKNGDNIRLDSGFGIRSDSLDLDIPNSIYHSPGTTGDAFFL
jgi:hypothetical protein